MEEEEKHEEAAKTKSPAAQLLDDTVQARSIDVHNSDDTYS